MASKDSLPFDDVDPHIDSPSMTTCLLCRLPSSTLGTRDVVEIVVPCLNKIRYVRFYLSRIKNRQPHPAGLHHHAIVGHYH
jgi:hypothetical protein